MSNNAGPTSNAPSAANSALDSLAELESSLASAEEDLTLAQVAARGRPVTREDIEELERVQAALIHRIQGLQRIVVMSECGMDTVQGARIDGGEEGWKNAVGVVCGQDGVDGEVTAVERGGMKKDLDELQGVCEGFMAEMKVDDRMTMVVDNVMDKLENDQDMQGDCGGGNNGSGGGT